MRECESLEVADVSSVSGLRLIHNQISHAGHQFEPRGERALYELASPAALSLPGANKGVVLISEMPGPFGQPDFVALVGGGRWLERRIAAGIPPRLSEAECIVLSALYVERPLSQASLSRRVGWSADVIMPILKKLVSVGALKVTPAGSFLRVRDLEPSGILYALEAKLKSWQRAVLQGRAYRSWADNYVVLLGGVGAVARQRAAETIALDRAGLFVDFEWIVKPKVRKAHPAKRLWGFEHMYAAVVASDPSFRIYENI